MIDVDVVLVNLDDRTAFCSDGITRSFFEMYDADAQPTEDPDLAIAAVAMSTGDGPRPAVRHERLPEAWWP